VYDGILAKQAYLAGDNITLADLFHLPYGVMAKNLGFSNTFEKYPNVKKWFEALMARDSWTQVTA
jgi:glutathione S-transferase